jgi:hypothetical protein
LPLGARIEYFAPDDVFCPFCPHVVQTLRHFLHTCPIAQAVWRTFASTYRLPHPPSLTHCLYSWPSSSSSHLGRAYGYRLQAGHAVAVHLLWVFVTQARLDDNRISPDAVPYRFLFLLRSHLQSLSRSVRWSRFFSDLSSSLSL